MGFIEKRDLIKINRNRVYLVKRIDMFLSDDEVLVRAYTNLDRAEAYIKEYEKRNRKYLRGALNKQGKKYSWFEDEYGLEWYFRIVSLELDCEYDEECVVMYNPTKS